MTAIHLGDCLNGCEVCRENYHDGREGVCPDCKEEMGGHRHQFVYSDYVPGIGECLCGAYRVWNREEQRYEEYEEVEA